MFSTILWMAAVCAATNDDATQAAATATATTTAELVLPLVSGEANRPEYRIAVRPTAPVTSLAFDAATRRLYAAQGEVVRVWDLASASSREPLAHPAITEPISAMALSADGTRLAVAAGRPSAVVVFPCASGGDPQVLKEAGPELHALAFSPDGTWLAAGASDGTMRVWKSADLAPVTLPDAPPAPGGLTDVAFSPDGRFLATTSVDGAIRLREVGSWKALDPLGHGNPAVALVFTSPDGAGMAVVSGRPGQGTRLVLRSREVPAARAAAKDQPDPAETAPYTTVTRTVEIGGGQPLDITVNPALKRLYAAGSVPLVRVLNADNGAVTATLRGHGAPVFAVAADRELARVASADADGLIMLWDASTGTRLATLIGPQESADDWLILTDRGPSYGPGLARARRAGSNAAVPADEAGVKTILLPASARPATGDAAKTKAKPSDAQPKASK